MAKSVRPRNWKSGPKCAICNHPERARIEALRLGGASVMALRRKFPDLSKDALFRHFKNHVSPERKAELLLGPTAVHELVEKSAKEDMALVDYLALARSTCLSQLMSAAEAGDRQSFGTLMGRFLEVLREQGKISGEIRQVAASLTINNNTATLLVSSPDFARLQMMLVSKLAPFPDAREAVLAGLAEMDGGASARLPQICEGVAIAAE